MKYLVRFAYVFVFISFLFMASCSNDSLPLSSGSGFQVVIEPDPIQGVSRGSAKQWNYTVRMINRETVPITVMGYTFLDTGIDKLYSDNADTRSSVWIAKNGAPWAHAGAVIQSAEALQYAGAVIRSARRFRVGTQDRTYFAVRPDGTMLTADVTLRLN